MKYLANAFSLQMINTPVSIKIEEVDKLDVCCAMKGEIISAIGHADTAMVCGSILGVEIPPNRISITVKEGDVLYVFQLIGGRLPEGTTTIPDGYSFKFLKVTVK